MDVYASTCTSHTQQPWHAEHVCRGFVVALFPPSPVRMVCPAPPCMRAIACVWPERLYQLSPSRMVRPALCAHKRMRVCMSAGRAGPHPAGAPGRGAADGVCAADGIQCWIRCVRLPPLASAGRGAHAWWLVEMCTLAIAWAHTRKRL
eukprot:16412-Chlamydomonas_euryale.AAC.4